MDQDQRSALEREVELVQQWERNFPRDHDLLMIGALAIAIAGMSVTLLLAEDTVQRVLTVASLLGMIPAVTWMSAQAYAARRVRRVLNAMEERNQ